MAAQMISFGADASLLQVRRTLVSHNTR